MKHTSKTAVLVKIAMLGVLAFVIEFVEFSLPFFPSFLKVDLSELISLIGAFALGPVAGMLVELVKNALHLTVSTTSGVGDLANFLVGSAFVMTAGAIYAAHRTRKGAIVSLVFAILARTAAGALVNYFITIPLYAVVLGWSTEMIVGMAQGVIPAINNKLTLIIFAFVPFNLFKGAVLSLFTLPLYKKVSPLLRRESVKARQAPEAAH